MAIERSQPRETGALSRYEPPVGTSPFSMMRRLSNEIDRMFDDIWGGRRSSGLFRGASGTGMWAPDVEVFERKNELVVRADLPGLTKEDVRVEVSDGSLVIHGERKEEQEKSDKGYYLCERSYGSFYRTVPLPEGIKADDARASFKEGVLEITIPAPKLTEKHGRQLEIK
jgi:HSP20 family protein